MKAMKSLVLCFALLCGAAVLGAQAPVWEQVVGAGGTSSEVVGGLVVDSAGNQFVTGYFRAISTFGTHIINARGSLDIFAAKLDPEGNWLWAVQAGGTETDVGHGISVDAEGNSYVTGYFQGTATFGDHVLISTGLADVFAAKLDPAGNWLWAVQAGGPDYWTMDSAYAIDSDGAGNTILAGYFNGTATFGDHVLEASQSDDIFTARLDPAGNWIQAVKGGGQGGDLGYGVALDDAGNAFVTGKFNNTAWFGDHAVISVGEYDIFAAKLSPTGNWLWAVSAGTTGWNAGNGVAVDDAGNVFLTGEFNGTATFGSQTLTSNGLSDIYAAKLDPAGNWLWAVQAGGTRIDSGCGISADSAGNAYLTGTFRGSATFGSHTLTTGDNDEVFAAKLDSDGNWLWALSAGGALFDLGVGIAADGAGYAYVNGYYAGTVTFGSHTLTSTGSSDVFMAKIGPTTSVDDELAPDPAQGSTLCDAFPNPLGRDGSALIKADIAERSTGTLSIYNLRGQIVASFELGPGPHQISFGGGELPAGIYLYSLQCGDYRVTKKLVLLE